MATRDNTGVTVYDTDGAGLIVFGLFEGANAPSDANKFAPGCILVGGGKVYSNQGSSASPSFQDINTINTSEIAAGAVSGVKLSAGAGYFQVAADTNGTTPVNVFGTAGAPTALVVKSVVSIAQDTTTGNIILKQAANTVATIAKGATSGALVGATTISNATYAAGDVCTVESSSAGNSRVLITFTVA